MTTVLHCLVVSEQKATDQDLQQGFKGAVFYCISKEIDSLGFFNCFKPIILSVEYKPVREQIFAVISEPVVAGVDPVTI